MPSVALGYAQKAIRSGSRVRRVIMRYPLEQEAIRLRGEAMRRGTGMIPMAKETCYTAFDANKLAASPDTISELCKLGEAWKHLDERAKADDKFPINLLLAKDIFEHRAFIDIAMHDEILSAVASYMGQLPRLYNLTLWWSPPNETVQRSQLYHYDDRDSRQAKVFINLNTITSESGPLHFIPADECLKLDAKIGYSAGRYTDEQVYSAVPKDKVIATTGGPGAGFIVDTARCLHYGSRGNKYDRFMIMASYARVNGVNPGQGCRVLDPIRSKVAAEYFGNDPVKSFVLNAPI